MPDAKSATHAGAEKLCFIESGGRTQRPRRPLCLLAGHATEPYAKQAHTAGPLGHVGQKLATTTTSSRAPPP